MSSDLSVVIPAYGCAGSIPQVLDGLLSQTSPVGEIIVVNDCSPDNLLEVLASYGDKITLIQNPRNLGLAATYNVGLKAARGRYLMTLHSDCVLDPSYVERLLRLLESDPRVGAVTGDYHFEGFSSMSFPDKVFSVINVLPILWKRPEGVVRLSFIEGKADIFRREAIEPCGFFEERLVLTCEDQDLSAKMRAQGWCLLQDCSCRFRVAYSSTQDSLRKVLRKQRTYSRGQGYILLTHRGEALKSTTGNRDFRMVHRGMQVASAGLSVVLLLGALVSPWALFGLVALLLGRYVYYVALSYPLRFSEAFLVGFLGVVADFCYTLGLLEGVFKTLTRQVSV